MNNHLQAFFLRNKILSLMGVNSRDISWVRRFPSPGVRHIGVMLPVWQTRIHWRIEMMTFGIVAGVVSSIFACTAATTHVYIDHTVSVESQLCL